MEGDDPSPELLAQMGFATFGAPGKKRKYNSAVDAVTSVPPPTTSSLPPRPPGPAGTANYHGKSEDFHPRARNQENDTLGRKGASGSNRMPLGRRKNAYENLQAMNIKSQEGSTLIESEDPDYVNHTSPGSLLENSSILEAVRKEDLETSRRPLAKALYKPTSQKAMPDRLNHQAQLDTEFHLTGPQAPSSRGTGLMEDGGHDWAALRRGVRTANGDTAYYDKSFVEDPWKEIMAG